MSDIELSTPTKKSRKGKEKETVPVDKSSPVSDIDPLIQNKESTSPKKKGREVVSAKKS